MDTDCVIHFKDKVLTKENKREFTEVTLKKFLDCRTDHTMHHAINHLPIFQNQKEPKTLYNNKMKVQLNHYSHQTNQHIIKKSRKHIRQGLSQAQTIKAGLLYDTAVSKEDEEILLQIRDKDCVAIEVKNHKPCYSRYTTLTHAPKLQKKMQTKMKLW